MSKFQAMKRKQAAAAGGPLSKSSPSGSSSPAARETACAFPFPPPQNRRWRLDPNHSALPPPPLIVASQPMALSITSSSSSSSSASSLPPTGYVVVPSEALPSASSNSTTPTQSKVDLVYNSAMAVGIAPGKQLLMTAFMLYMSGNSLQIFSIMMLGMALWQPIARLMSMQQEFSRYESANVNLILPKLLFLVCNVAAIALALWKASGLGLVPNSIADWMSTDVRPNAEMNIGGIIM